MGLQGRFDDTLLQEQDDRHEMVAAELKRILGSRPFAQARRLGRLLALMVDKMLAGEQSIHEHALGVEALDRDEAFDPRADPIVRVQVHKLRLRLREYYANEGADDPVEISIPVRTYVPEIRLRESGELGGARAAWNSPPATSNSLAVQPFATLSSDKQDQHFAEGLTQELIHALAKVPDLRVVAWAAWSPGWRPEVRDLARGLNVQALLTGTLRRSGGQVRVSAQLVSMVDGSVIWCRMLESEPEGPIITPERVALAISDGLCARIGVRIPAA